MKKVQSFGIDQLWWENAYISMAQIEAEYELQFGKDLIKAGDKIRIKNDRVVYLFRCIAHNTVLDTTWIDCIGPEGDWRSFRLNKLKSLVKPKKTRAKKAKP